MLTYEILLDGEPLRGKFETLKEAMTWGKSWKATSLIRISANGIPVGKTIYNPINNTHKQREF